MEPWRGTIPPPDEASSAVSDPRSACRAGVPRHLLGPPYPWRRHRVTNTALPPALSPNSVTKPPVQASGGCSAGNVPGYSAYGADLADLAVSRAAAWELPTPST